MNWLKYQNINNRLNVHICIVNVLLLFFFYLLSTNVNYTGY